MARCLHPYEWAEDGSRHSQASTSYKAPIHFSQLSNYDQLPSPVPSSLSGFVAGVSEGKETSSSTIHSMAERRRRERINAHLCTLRNMIPNSKMMDKASLLGKVIEQVKDLKRKATHLSKDFQVPKDYNEVTVECLKTRESQIFPTNDEEGFVIRASLCCDDNRPGLFSDIKETLQGLCLKVVKADMVSLGGRVRSVFVLCKDGDTGGGRSLVEEVREALSRIVSDDSVAVSGKRRRILQSQALLKHTIL